MSLTVVANNMLEAKRTTNFFELAANYKKQENTEVHLSSSEHFHWEILVSPNLLATSSSPCYSMQTDTSFASVI